MENLDEEHEDVLNDLVYEQVWRLYFIRFWFISNVSAL
jgi:hypothetical protein